MNKLDLHITARLQGVLKRAIWGGREVRSKLESAGIALTPSNFYSTVPSLEDIDGSFEYNSETPPFLNEDVFNADFLRQELIELLEYSISFNPPIEGDEEGCIEYFWKNSQFSYSDAMAYYSYIRKIKPKNVVEIGSGFSTLIAKSALSDNGGGKLTCIEPYPRKFLEGMNEVSLLVNKVQSVDAQEINDLLTDGDVLFIDSTHTVKSGSDCLHIYLRLLPFIKRNIFVHVHDVFLPFGMPKSWLIDHHIYWTEQYLLYALLVDNKKAKVLFGSAYHERFNKALINDFMRGRYPSGGGSLWFEYRGRE